MTGEPVRLRPLSLVDEGEDVLVGDPETGTFVAMPKVGGVVIAALQRGATPEEAGREATAFAGEPVDMDDFVATLRELGFVEDGEAAAPAAETASLAARRDRLASGVVRVLFGRTAWVVYAACALLNVGLLFGVPSLRPHPAEDAFVFDDIGRSILFLYPFTLVVMAAHEIWHWLAARAVGVPARFGVDRRMVFMVFETDLSQLWTVPRRRRFGPLLAGMAFDSVVLTCLLTVRLVAGSDLPPVVGSLAAAWSFVLVSQLLWQCMLFLRTDLYAVFITAARCRNLWRVKTLLLRRAFGRLSATEIEELDAADPRDVQVGLWFRWLWLAGIAAVAAWALAFVLPTVPPVVEWTADGVSAPPLDGTFWYTLMCAAFFFGPWLVVLALTIRGMDLRRAVRHDRSS
ncbi:hypothetical protein [Actinomadura rudentiformis]|uniref:PqqD family protein n=1 Tax=Actinomadura rudentiformis TaxID=359158 RepID=A0A6H9YBA0_9ACTN|nr:hypothetical protein [Actinomadura rudentiformis]KAB2342175.1 hypothetical protein F8566_39645 [Actinomadura rudentiformis]